MEARLFPRLIALFTLFLAVPAFAQDTTAAPSAAPAPKTYVVSADQLTTSQIGELEAKEKMATLETAGKYAGIGKEIGEGVSGALSALNEESQKFGDSQVGRFTMAMIAWKIMGQDVVALAHDMVGYIVGIPFCFGSLIALLWSYRRQCVTRRVLVKKGPGMWDREYKIVDPEGGSWSVGDWAIAHGIMFAVIVLISGLMIFA